MVNSKLERLDLLRGRNEYSLRLFYCKKGTRKLKRIPSSSTKEDRAKPPTGTRRYSYEGWTSYAVDGIRSSLFCGGRSRRCLLRENSGFCFAFLPCIYTYTVPAIPRIVNIPFYTKILYTVGTENIKTGCNWNTP